MSTYLHKILFVVASFALFPQVHAADQLSLIQKYPKATEIGTGVLAGVLGTGLGGYAYRNPYVSGTAGATLAALLAKRAWDTVLLPEKPKNYWPMTLSTLGGIGSGALLAKLLQDRGWNPYLLAAAAAGTGALCGLGASYYGKSMFSRQVDEYHEKQKAYLDAISASDRLPDTDPYFRGKSSKDQVAQKLLHSAKLNFVPSLELEKEWARRLVSNNSSRYIKENNQGLFSLSNSWDVIKNNYEVIGTINQVLEQVRGEKNLLNWRNEYSPEEIENMLNTVLQPYNYEKAMVEKFLNKYSRFFKLDKQGNITLHQNGNRELSQQYQDITADPDIDIMRSDNENEQRGKQRVNSPSMMGDDTFNVYAAINFLKKELGIAVDENNSFTKSDFIDILNNRLRPLHWRIHEEKKARENEEGKEKREDKTKQEIQSERDSFVESIKKSPNSKSLDQWRGDALKLAKFDSEKNLIRRAYTTEHLAAIVAGNLPEETKNELNGQTFEDLFKWSKGYTSPDGMKLTEHSCMAQKLKKKAVEHFRQLKDTKRALEILMLDLKAIIDLFNGSPNENQFIGSISDAMLLSDKLFNLKSLYVKKNRELQNLLKEESAFGQKAALHHNWHQEIAKKMEEIVDILSFASALKNQVTDQEFQQNWNMNNEDREKVILSEQMKAYLNDDVYGKYTTLHEELIKKGEHPQLKLQYHPEI